MTAIINKPEVKFTAYCSKCNRPIRQGEGHYNLNGKAWCCKCFAEKTGGTA